jgi:hypothetical protein
MVSTLVGQLPGRLNFGGNVGQGKVTMLFPSKKSGSGRERRDHAGDVLY